MGVRDLRGFIPSKKLLLGGVICLDNSANNGGILYFLAPLITIIATVLQLEYNYLRTRKNQDNTVGSRSKTDLAYIAGFLDGDGSLMLQIKKRKDGKKKFRFMCTICFYQDSRHETGLHWIRERLGIGYLSRRNDGMSEIRINGVTQIKNILSQLLPFIRFKKQQAAALYKAACLLEGKKIGNITQEELKAMIGYITVIQDNNYATRKKKSRLELFQILGLTP